MLTNEQIVELERQINDYSYNKMLSEKIEGYEDSVIYMGKIVALKVALDSLGYIVYVEKEAKKYGIKYKYYRLAEKEKEE